MLPALILKVFAPKPIVLTANLPWYKVVSVVFVITFACRALANVIAASVSVLCDCLAICPLAEL